jgi:phosphatidylserine/phosphatidylglycerophosphate/cardiolipin synthase-like enzyme
VSINVKVYDNGDHTCLVWLTDDTKPIPSCRGFTVRRLKGGAESYLHGFVGFSDDDKLDPAAPWKHPLQRYMWWDYGLSPGDVVQYSVVPVVGPDKDHLQLSSAGASALTPPMTISGQATPKVAAYFNKGIVAAQWVTRALAALGGNPKIADVISNITPPGNALRNELSGLLRPQILAMLADVRNKGGEIYAALYELNDPELIAALKSFGTKCHLVLANGAFQPPGNDENAAIRADLRNVVDLHDRLVTGNHFAHNKFIVCCDSSGTPQRVLSGSTNWTMTGLCTQANNGIIVDDPGLAADFLNEWNLIKSAGNDYPPSLATANSQSRTFNVDGGRITQWFAPTSAGQDLDYARQLINAAREGILFLFFNPGHFVPDGQPAEKWTLLQNILNRHHQGTPNFNAGLYIRGVVNQEIEGLTVEATAKPAAPAAAGAPAVPAGVDPSGGAPVTLFSGGSAPPQHLGVESMVPSNIKTVFHDWATEMLGSGVHIHSKVVVLDPFGENPVVMTGSHNLGFKASTANDDNLMIIEGNAPLAAAYAANIIAIYQAYRWNAYVEAHRQDPKVWHGLVDNDSWQSDYLAGDDLAEIEFWLGATAGGAAAAPPPPGGPARTTSVAGPASAPKPAPAPTPASPAQPQQASAGKKPSASKKAPVAKKAATKKAPAKKKAAVKKRAPAKKNKPAKKKVSVVKKKAPAKNKAPARKKKSATKKSAKAAKKR